MNEKFAQEHPLSFTAKFVLSSAMEELTAIAHLVLSYMPCYLAVRIPLKQNIAVTGSVNQKGEVQPVGGINEKIEGFFHFCEYCRLQEQGDYSNKI